MMDSCHSTSTLAQNNLSVKRSQEHIYKWTAIVFILLCTMLAVALFIVATNKSRCHGNTDAAQFPCPEGQNDALLTDNDPDNPGPFHEITQVEYKRLIDFLFSSTNLNLGSIEKNALKKVNESQIFTVDLFMPNKSDVLQYLNTKAMKPERHARVMVFRGDLPNPEVQEYRVGPLHCPTQMELIANPSRRNPVPFTIRPFSVTEFTAIYEHILKLVDEKVGNILQESYGGKFTNCNDRCLTFYPTPVGTSLTGNINERKMWMWANYPAEYRSLYSLDFGIRAVLTSSDPSQWSVDLVWYSGIIFDSLEQFAERYANDSLINKTKVEYVSNDINLKTAQSLRGEVMQPYPQRPPVQVEPDGKRYTITHRHIKYLHWEFDIRMSSFTGPQVYDIRWKKDRIVYELGLSEISVYYSGFSIIQKITDFVDSGALIGIHSRSLFPGTDCPEGATYLSASFFGELMIKPMNVKRAFCVFEHNTGVPLRRHLAYSREEGSFYAGMAKTALFIRSIFTIGNYDYIIDYIFHQTGAVEVNAISTGYVLSTFYTPLEASYGFHLDGFINGNIHHHMFHFKVDLDVAGTSNRYEILKIKEEEVELKQVNSSLKYSQIAFDRVLHKTEDEAVLNFLFNEPKYHIIYNNREKTRFNVPRAYRLLLKGMSPQLLKKGRHNERTIPWARQQMAVTQHKSTEQFSSSPYAMFDSFNPVVKFDQYINNESIVDEDLVFWITLGVLHIPHTEDLPVTSTVGGDLSFFLLPYNYFQECPSVSSRDGIRVDFTNAKKSSEALNVTRNGNKVNTFCGEKSLEDLVRENPQDFIQVN